MSLCKPSSLSRINTFLGIFLVATCTQVLDATTIEREGKYAVDSLEDITLGGIRQKILIQGDDIANPILLWLHGGPGSPAMLLGHHFSSELRRHLTIVHWDQRGAGLSYDPELEERQISEDLIESDAVELSQWLAQRFEKKKIYLLGHSFGSVIGLRLAFAHPELFHAYIGVGQVIKPSRSEILTYAWLEHTLRQVGDQNGLERIREARFPVFDLVIKYGGRMHQPVDYYGIIESSPYYFDGYIEQMRNARGFCQKAIAANRTKGPDDFFREAPELKVPAYFMEGRFDRVPACAPALVVEYCRRVRAPRKEVLWFDKSAHLPNLEEPERFQALILDKIVGDARTHEDD
jgi:pimeloyl-ACP methyl ester carboxylesterase